MQASGVIDPFRASAAQLMADGAATLAAAGVDSARLEAELLLARAWGLDRTALYARAGEPVPAACRREFLATLTRRCTREPLQYLLGHQEFWSLDFIVTAAVLIPRPETELLVEMAVAAGRSPRSEAHGRLRICDVGTGSGCVAVALAHELPQADVWALDVSPAALAIARDNTRRHGVGERLRCLQSDLLTAVAGERFDIIVSNPPYVSTPALAAAQPELGWEPRAALDGGPDGLAVIRRLLAQAPRCLVDGGCLLMEIGADQTAAVEAVARQAGWREIGMRSDYAGRPRVLSAQT